VHQSKSFLLLVQLTPFHCISFSTKANKVIGNYQVIGKLCNFMNEKIYLGKFNYNIVFHSQKIARKKEKNVK